MCKISHFTDNNQEFSERIHLPQSKNSRWRLRRATTIYDCHSAMTINICSASSDMNSGGMVGEVTYFMGNVPDLVVVERCTFTGKLVEYVNLDVKGCAGFIGHINPNITVTLRDCVFAPHDWNYHEVVYEGSTFANTESGTILNLERCYATMQMKKPQGTFILNKMTVPEGVTYEFQGEPAVTLGTNYYYKTIRLQPTAIAGNTHVKYIEFWQTDGIDTIRTIDLDGTERYYDLNGRQLPGKPQRGVYIHNGKKHIANGQQ